MLSAPTLDVPNFPEDDWLKGPSSPARLYRAASVGNSWGVTSFGRGFDWANNVKSEQTDSPVHDKDVSASRPDQGLAVADESYLLPHLGLGITRLNIPRPASFITSSRYQPQTQSPTMTLTCQTRDQPISQSPPQSLTSSPIAPSATPRTPLPQSPSITRPRRRSSQQRVSLIAGRVSIAPIEPPSPPPVIAPSLERANSTSSFLSVATSVGPPSPRAGKESFLDGRSISEFFIEGDIGRGAYGLVKRAREINKDGSLGVRAFSLAVDVDSIFGPAFSSH
jgi:protein-serine/threonine kinase